MSRRSGTGFTRAEIAGPSAARTEKRMSANESLGRAQELAERLRSKLDDLERLADAGDVDAAVDDLAEIAELAKQIEAEVQRARASADAGA